MTADSMENGAERKRRSKREQQTQTASQSFEEQLEELDGIVTALEDGRLPLEDALALYERGMRLAKACQDRLDQAELRVSRLRTVAPEAGETDVFTLEEFLIDE
ncbi:MAG TPA: exodeoxyribonuclease VII small subunit [Ktedonobacterales bacterium]